MTTVTQKKPSPSLGLISEQGEVLHEGRFWAPRGGDYIKHRYYSIKSDELENETRRVISYYVSQHPKERKRDLSIQIGNETIVLPSELNELIREIEKSKYMLALEDNWDDEGSPKYDPNTWQRAVHFLVNYSKKIYELFGKVIQVPKIFHSVNGSVDLLWKNKQYQLLVNIPSGTGIAKFYGDNFDSNSVEGSFDPANYSVGLMLTLLDQGNVAD